MKRGQFSSPDGGNEVHISDQKTERGWERGSTSGITTKMTGPCKGTSIIVPASIVYK
jgi:hypothetical protein